MEMKRYAACLITGFLLGMAIYFIFNHARRDSNKNNIAVPEMVFVDRVEHRREKGEIPLFGPPTDSDKINFIRNADINSFEHLDWRTCLMRMSCLRACYTHWLPLIGSI